MAFWGFLALFCDWGVRKSHGGSESSPWVSEPGVASFCWVEAFQDCQRIGFFGENMETNVDNIWTILNNSMKLREHLVLDIGSQIRGWQTEFVDLWGIEVQKLSGETTHISALSTDTTADLILGWWILCQQSTSGWWFGTFCIFPYIYILYI